MSWPFSRDPDKPNAKVVRVGVLDSMTGVFPTSVTKPSGLQCVIDKINKSGGIKSMGGAKIELVPRRHEPGGARGNGSRAPDYAGERLAGRRRAADAGDACGFTGRRRVKTPVLSHSAAGARGDYMYSMGLPYDRGYAKTMVEVR